VCLVGSGPENRAEITGGSSLDGQDGRCSNNLLLELGTGRAALVSDGIAYQDDALEQLLVGLVQIAEWEAPAEKGIGTIVGEVVWEPIDVSAAAEHNVARNGVRLEGHTRMDIPAGRDSSCKQANEEILQQSLERRNRA